MDGTLKGPDYVTLANLCKRSGINVIASGGIGSLGDVSNLRQIGVWGVVIGKALYEGLFNLKDALRIARGS
jgi:phosphoribosylformimino-5-aminoimidazole carboxamide ribotide isomerase